jgi:hypothetical protein
MLITFSVFLVRRMIKYSLKINYDNNLRMEVVIFR